MLRSSLIAVGDLNRRRVHTPWACTARISVGSALVNVLLPAVHPRMGNELTAANSSPLLEPPGFLLRNYGRGTPIATLLAHIAYGAIVGGFASIAG